MGYESATYSRLRGMERINICHLGIMYRDVMEWWDIMWFALVLLLTGLALRLFAYTPMAPAPASGSNDEQAPERIYRPQTWCFVGENTLGRYCVQSDSCSPMDRFPSRETCEYVEASALPLGVTGEGGLHYTPFMSRETRYSTF
jgi:hypothetical protein